MARRSTKSSPRASGDNAEAGSGASERVSGWVTVVLGLMVSGFLLWRNHPTLEVGSTTLWRNTSYSPMSFMEYNLLNTTFILFVPLIVLMLGLRKEPAEFGLTLGDWKLGGKIALILFALFVPVLLIAGGYPDPQRYYIQWLSKSGAVEGAFWNGTSYGGGRIVPLDLFIHELIMGFYMFGWEWYHRGFLLNGAKKVMPVWAAVLFQSVLFMVLHWGKPPLETLSSFPGGILMGILAIRTRSFLPCFLLHWLISAGFDFAVLYHHFR